MKTLEFEQKRNELYEIAAWLEELVEKAAGHEIDLAEVEEKKTRAEALHRELSTAIAGYQKG